MNTPTHTLLAMALLSKGAGSDKTSLSRVTLWRNWAVFIGSLIPDIAIYIWAPWQKYINGASGRDMWRHLYFEESMQLIIAPPNSIPLFVVLALTGFIARAKTWGLVLLMLSLAALIHIATDFPVHNHDAYRHFWPLSDWRFHSPLSYWQDSSGGRWVGLFEMLLGLACTIVLWRRFPKLWVKLILSLVVVSYLALNVMMWVAPFTGPP